MEEDESKEIKVKRKKVKSEEIRVKNVEEGKERSGAYKRRQKNN